MITPAVSQLAITTSPSRLREPAPRYILSASPCVRKTYRLCSTAKRHTLLGLPGNPVSVSVTFNLFARTALLAMQGAKDPAAPELGNTRARGERHCRTRVIYRLNSALRKKIVIGTTAKMGRFVRFRGFVRATSMIIVPAGTGLLEVGTKVRVMHLPA